MTAVCILLHGLGMDKTIWTDPANARLLGGLSSIGRLIPAETEFKTVFHDLQAGGYEVHVYSQRRPVGPMGAQVIELADFIGSCAAGRRVVLIGHSRGGLIARAYAEGVHGAGIGGLITIGSPHGGSGLARWALYARPMAERLARLIPDGPDRGVAIGAARRVLGLLGSRAMEELLPGSAFIRSLSAAPPAGMTAYSIGGTNPDMFRIGPFFSYPGSIRRILPESRLPAEMLDGEGDGLVTAHSARLCYAIEHRDFRLDHIRMLMDSGARSAVMGWVRAMDMGMAR